MGGKIGFVKRPDPELTSMAWRESPVAQMILDSRGNVLMANRQCGFLPGEPVLGRCYEYLSREKPCRKCPLKNALESGRQSRILKKTPDVQGKIRCLELTARPLPFPDQPGLFLYTVVDRTGELELAEELEDATLDYINILSHVLLLNDKETFIHSETVGELALLIAEHMGISEREKRELAIAAALHDIGKVGVVSRIIRKPGELTEAERSLVRSHSLLGEEIVSQAQRFSRVGKIIRNHHEMVDGNGYPDGLRGEEIPLASRIIAVADAYDAMANDRVYRKALDRETVIGEFRRCAGRQFDPDVAGILVKLLMAAGDSWLQEHDKEPDFNSEQGGIR